MCWIWVGLVNFSLSSSHAMQYTGASSVCCGGGGGELVMVHFWMGARVDTTVRLLKF